ncbi:Glycerophosphoryl diester phosphodiesterase [Acidisarcina polymorpha]|uniref:Glycerophosphoryl diester phosphodiesterase n=1 Tax=Acidisarcina polymorpha TaxID=2211140 RepID=A0A2Z5FY09_9BACT|nr:HEAT repeat domain-containing protein [Acidisarcina polymorpha]AXC11256.1 Glycerophosphoryl diester phosphodiesterase [Acidisarcina polymorpha]
MKQFFAVLFIVLAATVSQAGTLLPGSVQLRCHRTANEDVPENTLESLEQAALLGCNVVEIDLRRTLGGEIVLNHDGILERLTDGVGETEKSYYEDLELRDAGSWMGERFAGMHIVLFEDALRMARRLDVRLVLDIKTKGIGLSVLEVVRHEGMLERVQFGGQWSDVKQIYPDAKDVGDGTVWVQPGITETEVRQYHLKGKSVVANFSANEHEMDLPAMKAAVVAGVDAINVDYPRLGADAVGRPVEHKLQELSEQADNCASDGRVKAILQLSRYRGLPLQNDFARWLSDGDDHVSRAAAVALVTARPRTPISAFTKALRSQDADARANAAWALGMLEAPASTLLPLLHDQDPAVLQAALMALSRAPGDAPAEALLPMLSHGDPAVRGAAAMALAKHQPEIAIRDIPPRLRVEMSSERVIYDDRIKRGKAPFTPSETDALTASFRCQMKMVQAISMLKGTDAMQVLEELAFRSDKDFAQVNATVAAFDMWDRIGGDPRPAVEALGSADNDVAERAEWMLVQGGPAVLPEVRKALANDSAQVRERAIQVLAWQGDPEALDALKTLSKNHPAQEHLALWAIAKIEMLHPKV